MFCDCDMIHSHLVEEAKNNLINESDLLEMSALFKAISDSTRIKIVEVLKDNELCVCDISVILNMTKSAVSHQLKYLKTRNLIKARRKGKEIWYSLADEHVRDLLDISFEHIKEGV